MLYLMGQIFIYLIIAALLGAVIGWWLHGRRCRVREDELTAELEGKVVALKSAEKKIVQLQGQQREYEQDRGREIEGLNATIGDLRAQTAALQKQIDDALQVFQGRIVRDNWIGSGQVEYQKKYGTSI